MSVATGSPGARSLLVALLTVVLAGCGNRIDPDIVVEDMVSDLLAPYEPASVTSRSDDAPVTLARIKPGEWLRGDGPRPTLVMPAPANVAFRVTTAPGAILRFGAGVGGVTRRQEDTSGVRFEVRLDGIERWSRTIHPSATRRDRRWFDVRLPLPGGPVRVELATAIADPRYPAPGVPGFSGVQVLRSSSHRRQPATPSAPNVVVIVVDTMRADYVGGTPSSTPNLDALGARGLVFERAIAHSSWTLESVPSLLTGLLPQSHGVRGDYRDAHSGSSRGGRLSDEIETFAEAAARTGVTTMAVSANPIVSRATNLSQGFETFREFQWDPQGRRFASAAEVNAVFLDWLHDHRGLRFLAYLHYMEPHDPYAPPSPPPAPPGLPAALGRGWIQDAARRINRLHGDKLPAWQIAHLQRLYRGEIHAWDASLPVVLGGLRDAGVLDSTIVVVTSDHGEEFQEHGYLKHGQSLHEELVHVPLTIAGPGVPAGHRSMQVQGIDLFPTLAHVLGLPIPKALAGRDLLSDDLTDATVVSATHSAIDGDRMVDSVSLRTAEWTLLGFPESGRYALYHRPTDPAEHVDLFAKGPQGPALVAELEAALVAAPRHTARPADLRQRLRALGYTD